MRCVIYGNIGSGPKLLIRSSRLNKLYKQINKNHQSCQNKSFSSKIYITSLLCVGLVWDVLPCVSPNGSVSGRSIAAPKMPCQLFKFEVVVAVLCSEGSCFSRHTILLESNLESHLSWTNRGYRRFK